MLLRGFHLTQKLINILFIGSYYHLLTMFMTGEQFVYIILNIFYLLKSPKFCYYMLQLILMEPLTELTVFERKFGK
jgi:hypothetical protein